MGWQTVIAVVFQAGNTTIINPNGLFVYAGTPGLGTLIASIAPAAGTDSFGNNYAKGIEIKAGGLTLDNQGSAPPAVSGASVFYSSVAGRPRYLSSAGADAVLERSEVNVSQFSLGNSTTATQVSAPLVYQPNEGNQSSEYEIEIMGTGTPSNAGQVAHNLDFRLFVAGVNFGGGFKIDNTFWQLGVPFRFTIRYVLTIQATGVGGLARVHGDGMLSYNDGAANAIKTNTSIDVGGDIDSAPFDTTVQRTLQIMAFWGSTVNGTGQSLTTFRTKVARRM